MGLRVGKWLQAMSLDVAGIAVLLFYAICQLRGIRPDTIYLAGLFLAVWTIYLSDHLIDYQKNRETIVSFRRLFYARNHRVLLVVVLLNSLVLLGLFLSLDRDIQKIIVLIATGVLAYLLFASSLKAPIKEVTASLLYTIGLFLLTYLHQIDGTLVLLSVELFIVAWINMLMLALKDMDIDQQEGFLSLPIVVGKEKAERIMQLLVGLLLVLFAIGFFVIGQSRDLFFHCSLLVVGVVQYILYLQSASWKLRLLSDLAFLLPVVSQLPFLLELTEQGLANVYQ